MGGWLVDTEWKDADRLARRADLQLTPDVRPYVLEVLSHRHRFSASVGLTLLVGLLFLLLTGTVPTWAFPFSYSASALILWQLFPALVVPKGNGTRLTHAHRPTIADYATEWQMGSWVALPLLGVLPWLALLLTVHGRSYPDEFLLWLVPTFSLFAPLLTWALAHRVVTVPRSAATVQQLAFDDALRWQAVSSLDVLPLAVLLSQLWGAVVWSRSDHGVPSADHILTVVFGVAICLVWLTFAVFLSIRHRRLRPPARFKQRLYPDALRAPVTGPTEVTR